MGKPSVEMYDRALRTVRQASCNCYVFEPDAKDSVDTRASLLTANLNLSDTCTFRIIAKNVSVLNSADDPLRTAAFSTIDKLIMSYLQLDSVLLQAGEWDSETKEQVVPLLDKTIGLQQDLRQRLLDLIYAPIPA